MIHEPLKTSSLCAPMWLGGVERGNQIDRHITDVLNDTLTVIAANGAFDESWQRRYRTGCQFLIPSIARSLDISSLDRLRELSALEIGCGAGAKSAALSHFVKSYMGVDINEQSLDLAKYARNLLGRNNLEFARMSADEVGEKLFNSVASFDVVVLYAVIEHLTIAERLRLLSSCWAALRPGGLLLIAELPNRMCPVDHHSSYLAYYDCLPDELALLYGKRSRRPDFLKRVYEADDRKLGLYRIGRGASFHEFVLSIGELPELRSFIVQDSWSNSSANQFPVRNYERALLQEFSELKNDGSTQAPKIPAGFARYWLELGLRKKPSEPLGSVRFANLEYSQTERLETIAKDDIIVDVPRHSTQVTVGWRTETLNSPVQIRNGMGEVLFESDGRELKQALRGHFNPQIFVTRQHGGARFLHISSHRREARVECVYFR